MRKPFWIGLIGVALICGCVDMGPFISKSDLGNLEINVTADDGIDIHSVCIYVDDVFVGNVSSRLPILYLKNGKHTVRVDLEGAESYRQAITILGDPNHQVLNVVLKKKAGI